MPHFLILNLGTGSEGCLGHGTLEHSKKPRIVEALLGSMTSGYGNLFWVPIYYYLNYNDFLPKGDQI